MVNYLLRHLQTALYALGQLWRQPWGTLMSGAVIGISLALPTALYLGLSSLQEVGSGWQGDAQISAFLRARHGDQGPGLAGRIAAWPGVAEVRYISPDEALQEFQARAGFGDVLELLPENPLPGVLVVRPDGQQLDQIEHLVERLKGIPEVEAAQFDLQWVQRLAALLSLGRRLALVLAAMLGLGVLLITGNTIRLAIYNRRQEIEVSKLIGATDPFIRRPFLYSGLLLGTIGGLMAVLIVYSAGWLLGGPADRLASLYGSDLRLATLGTRDSLLLLTGAALLGLSGAWIAVARHLKEIEPS